MRNRLKAGAGVAAIGLSLAIMLGASGIDLKPLVKAINKLNGSLSLMFGATDEDVKGMVDVRYASSTVTSDSCVENSTFSGFDGTVDGWFKREIGIFNVENTFSLTGGIDSEVQVRMTASADTTAAGVDMLFMKVEVQYGVAAKLSRNENKVFWYPTTQTVIDYRDTLSGGDTVCPILDDTLSFAILACTEETDTLNGNTKDDVLTNWIRFLITIPDSVNLRDSIGCPPITCGNGLNAKVEVLEVRMDRQR